VPCLKCGGKSEGDALLCDACAEASFSESKFFLNPVLIGPSLYTRLRAHGSDAFMLGPNTSSDIDMIASADLQKSIKDMNVQGLQHDELNGFYQRCNSILAHLGVPLKLDSPQILLTEDASDTITAIVAKVNMAEKMFPLEGMSDLYIRIGIVYWCAAHSILMRTASEKWTKGRKSYLTSRAKEYLSKVGPTDDLYSIAVRDIGMVCLDSEEWTAAEENLANAIRHFPNDFKIGVCLARSHLMLGNEMEALSSLDEVLIQGDRPELWVLKGQILRKIDRREEALECFNRALQIDPNYMPAHEELIGTLKDAGRLDEAVLAENQRSLSKRPDLEQKINEMIFEFKKATSAVESGGTEGPTEAGEIKGPPIPDVQSDKPVPSPAPAPKPARGLIDIAKDALKARDFDSAMIQAQHILRSDPGNHDANLVLIEALVSKGNLREAAPKIHTFYEKNNMDPKAWYWRGELARREGKWGAAVQYFSKAVSLNPTLVEAWVSMGQALLEHDRFNGADESFSRALEIETNNTRAWLGKGKALKALGRWGAAVQCLDSYTVLAPKDSDAWLLKADLLFENEKYNRAFESYDKYLALVGDDSYALGRKGISLNAIGRVEEAKKVLEESAQLDPGNKEARKWLKMISGGS
jgi:tetratricopeptide (TPR) repeat protein